MNHEINLPVGFLDHPKTRDLIRQLGSDAIVCLLRLWSYCATQSIYGRLPDDADEIEHLARWRGEPDLLLNTLIDLGWVDESESEYQIHEWIEHQTYCANAHERIDKARRAGRASVAKRRKKLGTAQPPGGRQTGSDQDRTASSIKIEPSRQDETRSTVCSVTDTDTQQKQNRSDTDQPRRAEPVKPKISEVALGVHQAIREASA